MWVMISGPYTAGGANSEQRARNLEAMNSVAWQVMQRGHTPIIGVNLALPVVRAAGEEKFDEIMMPLSMGAAERCDAVIRIGGPSKGADEEVASFVARGLPVYSSAAELPLAENEARTVLDAATREFRRYKDLADKATAQLDWPQLREAFDPETNSIAVIMKHVSGNLGSRWTDVLTSDGEKPWRTRDNEFVDDFADRGALTEWWEQGWNVLFAELAKLKESDLARTVFIRNEPHSLALALERSLAHTAYHVGRITQLARALASKAGKDWTTLTVPRGGTAAHNRKMGYDPGKAR